MDVGSDKQEPQAQEGGWQYKTDAVQAIPSSSFGAQDSSSVNPTPATKVVEWTASEFVAHDKGVRWYVVLGAGAIVVSALIYLVTRDVVSTVVILFLAIIFGFIGARKPRVRAYRLDGQGLRIGNVFHPYRDFKAFTLKDEQPFISIELLPLKRFGFPLSVYLAPENENEALELLSQYLPLERGKQGGAEQLMRHLRF